MWGEPQKFSVVTELLVGRMMPLWRLISVPRQRAEKQRTLSSPVSPVTEMLQFPAVFLPSPGWAQTSHVEGSHVLGTILLGDDDRDGVKLLPGGHLCHPQSSQNQ